MNKKVPGGIAAAVGMLSAALGAGCPDDGQSSGGGGAGAGGAGGSPIVCPVGFIGDPAKEPEIEAFYWGADEADHAIADGAVIDIIEPPQGGRVIFIGARARNLDGCAATLTGSFRDLTNNQVRFDTRNVNLEETSDGWGTVHLGDLSVYANVAVCQNSWSDQTIYDGSFELEVKLEDRGGLSASASFEAAATCTDKSLGGNTGPTALEQCLCICKAGYMLGDTCEGGGGGGAGGGGTGGGG